MLALRASLPPRRFADAPRRSGPIGNRASRSRTWRHPGNWASRIATKRGPWLPAAARAGFVGRECGGDAELRAAVERLLAADQQPADAWLEQGVGRALRGADPLAGARFGAFELVERLAEGGMGTVHLARRVGADFEQIVAVKVLRFGLSTPHMRDRFARERQTLARLVHPNVARLLDGGTTPDGVPFIAMEFVDGVPLDRFCHERALPLRERLKLFVAVCGAVQFAHQNLVVHLDLKPSNILVDRHGTPKLLDFGVAGLLDEMRKGDAGVRPLTPGYASPEQLRGEPVSTAADVYALGVVLREVASDREQPLRGDLAAIVAKAAHEDAAVRYASCQALADDVERLLGSFPVRARNGGVGYRLAAFVRRNALGVSAAGLITASLIGGIVATSHMASVANTERDAAEEAKKRAEHQMGHARIESSSAQLLAAFLGDTLLSADFADTPEARARLCRVIDERAAQFRREFERDPHLRANLLDALGRTRARVGEPADAERLLLEARDVRSAAFGEQSLEYAQSLTSLGTLWYGTGRLAEAADVLRTCYELHRACEPDVHTDVARAANDLAAAERALGSVARAHELHEEALALRRRDGETAAVAESLNNLANSEPDPAKAAQYLADAWRIRKAVRRFAGAAGGRDYESAAGVARRRRRRACAGRTRRRVADAGAAFARLRGVAFGRRRRGAARGDRSGAARAPGHAAARKRARSGGDDPRAARRVGRRRRELARSAGDPQGDPAGGPSHDRAHAGEPRRGGPQVRRAGALGQPFLSFFLPVTSSTRPSTVEPRRIPHATLSPQVPIQSNAANG